jgi:uncharacterized membrane protein
MEPSNDIQPVPSKVAVAGHPVHPMIVPFPVALLVLVAVTDVIHLATGDEAFWALASYYLLWAGLATAALAAVVGLIDFVAIPRARAYRAGWLHFGANVTIVVLAAINLALRVDHLTAHITPAGIVLSLATAAMLGVSGWYGGELAYRYRIGVMDESALRARRLRRVERGAAA